MCGIVGVVVKTNDFNKYIPQIVKLFQQSQARGRDGWGVSIYNPALIDGAGIITCKSMGPIDEFITLSPVLEDLPINSTIIFNTRAAPVTEGEVSIKNVQPFNNRSSRKKNELEWHWVHNGIISNDQGLTDTWDLNPVTNVDSEVLPHLRAKFPIDKGPEFAKQLIGGVAAIGISDKGHFEIVRNYKTLYTANINDELLVVASMKQFIYAAFDNSLAVEFPKESVATGDVLNNIYAVSKYPAQYLAHTPDLNPNKMLIVISGGMDSTLTAYIAAKMFDMEVELIHFDYGHKSLSMEKWSCEQIAYDLGVPLHIIDLSWLGELGASPLTDADIPIPLGRTSSKTSLCWTPARNLVMLSIAAAYAEAKGIKWVSYGNNLEEEGPAWKDNDTAAVRSFNDAFFYGTLKGVSIVNMLGQLMKRDIITLATHLGVPLDKTCSCDEPIKTIGGDFQACGRCGCCHNRRHAFMQANTPDPQTYAYEMIEHYPSINDTSNIVTDLGDVIKRVVSSIEMTNEEFAQLQQKGLEKCLAESHHLLERSNDNV